MKLFIFVIYWLIVIWSAYIHLIYFSLLSYHFCDYLFNLLYRHLLLNWISAINYFGLDTIDYKIGLVSFEFLVYIWHYSLSIHEILKIALEVTLIQFQISRSFVNY